MNRREILLLGAAAAAGAAAPGMAAAQAGRGKNRLDAYSRTLHWLRTPHEIAQACRQIGNTTIDLTVRPYPGHVQPEKATTDLPVFVKALAAEGIATTKIAMDVVDAETPNLEAVLDAQAQLGVRHIWWRGVPLDWTQPYPRMIDAAKARVAPLARLLEKYGVKACWHPFGGFTEILDVCRAFDPRFVAIDYDTGNFGQFNQGMLANQMRIAGPYVGSFVFKDFVVERQAQGAAPAAGPARAPTAANGWRSTQVPVGAGVMNLALIARTLGEIGFQGPIECQPEWAAIDGAGQGLDRLSIPPAEVIAMLRRDYEAVSAPLAAAGVI